MIREPYIRIKTIDYSNLSDTVPDSLNVAMVINSDTGPTAITKITDATQLIKYYSTKQQLNIVDDVTFKHAAKLLQFTPLYLTRAFDNSVICGYTDKGDRIYTDLEYNILPYSLKVELPEPIVTGPINLSVAINSTTPTKKIVISSENDYDTTLARIVDAPLAEIRDDPSVTNDDTSGEEPEETPNDDPAPSSEVNWFKSVISGDNFIIASETHSIVASNKSEVQTRFDDGWSYINFDNNHTTLKISDYICINGYSYYPAYGDSSNASYPNIPVAINVDGTENNGSTDIDGFKLGLLDNLISKNSGLSEIYPGVKVTISGLALSEKSDDKDERIRNYNTDNAKLYFNSGAIYSNSINFNNSSDRLALKYTGDSDGNTYIFTLPYDSSYKVNVDSREVLVDTSSICSLYGVAYMIREGLYRDDAAKNTSITCDTTKLYVRTAEVNSYSTMGQDWVNERLGDLTQVYTSVVPKYGALSTDDEIGTFYIRILDYVFYNVVISDLKLRNNPDVEQIKISTVPLTYKQLLVKLRKAVGDVFNSTNTENGFTLYWRVMPDRTKFGASKITGKDIKWNGLVFNPTTTTTTINSVDSAGSILKINVPSSSTIDYETPPVIDIDAGDGKAQFSVILANKKINSIDVIKGGTGYKDTDVVKIKSAVDIKDTSSLKDSAKFAVIARFPSKTPILQFSYIRQDIEIEDGDPELYTFSLEYKGENVGDSTISFVENKIDGYNRSVYYTYYNDINDFVQIIPLNGEMTFKKYTSKIFGDEIPVVEPEVDDYIGAAQRFKIKTGVYYDFLFDGGYANAAYAKNLMELCKGGTEDSLWAVAMISCINDKDWKDRIMFREATAIDNCNAQMFGDWVVDTTIADFAIDISCGAIALERIFANRTVGKEFASIFGPANGSMQYRPKYPILDKDIREKLLNKQINTLIWDESLQLSYFNLDITLQTADSSMSDCNNVRTVNCQSHIADNYMKWYWGRVNDEATRNEVIQGLRYRIDQRCINNQQYHIDDYLIVCNDTNNPPSVVENRQLVVDVKDKFRPGIRYIDVFNKIYRLTQDFDAIG